MIRLLKQKRRTAVLILGLASLGLMPISAFAASMPITGWAWSAGTDSVNGASHAYMGWLKMHNVVEDTETGAISGYAWSSHLGWVSFNAAHTSGCPSGECAAKVDFNDQKIHGWARACSAFANKNACTGALDPYSGGWDGWIALSGASYGIKQKLDCTWEGYSWGSAAIGAIKFGPIVRNGVNHGAKGIAGHAACKPLSTKPNLTASPVTVNVATVNPGVPVTLSSTISNLGVSSTGTEFPVLFQIHPGSIPATLAETSVKKNLALATLDAGLSVIKTNTHTFPTKGIWYVHACADTGTIVNNVVDESNEDDNCGNEWKRIDVGAEDPEDPEDPPVCTPGSQCFSTSKNNCGTPGTGVCRADGTCNAVVPSDAVCPGGPDGEVMPVVEITATPLRVPKDGTTNVAWRATNVTQHCKLSSTPSVFSTSEALLPDANGVVEGSEEVTISEQTLLKLTCRWNTPPEDVSDQAIVNILPDFNEF